MRCNMTWVLTFAPWSCPFPSNFKTAAMEGKKPDQPHHK
jgi:hypothetical protein